MGVSREIFDWEKEMSDEQNRNFVSHIEGMADKYDSEFLRGVAEKMNYIIEEQKDEQDAASVEIVGQSTST
jgi:hypothetical protein